MFANELGMNIVAVASVIIACASVWVAIYFKKHHHLPF